jgi:5-formyltetrahydrofolate cyclo-ligase
LSAAPIITPLPARQELRSRLLGERMQFAAGAAAADAASALARVLRAVVADLEPQCLGLYWPHRAEFNAPAALLDDAGLRKSALALPFARRVPLEMEYRLWNGHEPKLLDECGIPAADGASVVPDVVLVPCVGYTESGLRLGYGGGYFDRWLGAHPQVCAVGVAWSAARLDDAELVALPHDVRLALIVTERGPV